MKKPLIFFVFITVIFILERFQIIFHLPMILFPAFIVLFMLLEDSVSALPYIIGSGFFFDLFSGFVFGWVTISILVVYFTINLAKRFISIGNGSFFFLLIVSFIFIAEYFLVLSARTPRLAIFGNLPALIGETLVVSALMIVASRKAKLF